MRQQQSAKELHRAAMINADIAYAAKRQGDLTSARKHFRRAFRFEMEAVEKLRSQKGALINTIILLYSAACLACQALEEGDEEEVRS